MDGQMSLDGGVGLAGEYMAKLADEWIARNWYTWNKMLTKAAEYAAQGRRFSMETLFQFARYECADVSESQGFRVNNNTRAALARKMLSKYPAWDKYVDTRRSKVDWV